MKKNNYLSPFFKLILSAFLFELLTCNVNAQNTFPSTGSAGIGTITPDMSSKLEIKSTTRGFLAPRMNKTQRNAIGTPATGLLIYQIDSTPGFYYYGGSAWKAVSPAASGWSLKGNAGTTPGTNFIGTTDAQPLVFKVNNNKSGLIDYNGNNNTSFGYQSLLSNTTGFYNTAVGYGSLKVNMTGVRNTAVGGLALYSNTMGTDNTANGFGALYSNTIATENTAFGLKTLFYNTTGEQNTACGSNALSVNVGGNRNTASGNLALVANDYGSDNTAMGHVSLQNNTQGNGNTAIGSGSQFSNFEGSYNTAVGYQSDVVGNISNSTAIGYAAGVGSSNSCVIGNASITLIGGLVGWSTLSDGRFKRNLQNNVPGLSFITQLKPVTYTLDVKAFNKFSGADDRIKQLEERQKKDKSTNTKSDALIDKAIKQKESILYTGFVAQEVEQAANNSGYDFSGIHKPQNEKDNYSLDYSSFVVPLVKAVQELSARNDDLQKQIEELKGIVTGGNSKTLLSNSISLTNASLDQNNPNPYTNNTTIGYTLPQKFSTAQIIITDKSGRTLKHISVSGSGKGSLNVDAATLASGAYNYTLFVDNKLVATKQMELVKY